MNRIFILSLWIPLLLTLCNGDDTMLTVGTQAPDFSLLASNGDSVTLSSFRAKKNVVLIFYPGDETPVCTKQLCEIRDDYSLFEGKNAVVFGVNPASVQSHKKFAEKHQFQFPLLIDVGNQVAKSFGTTGVVMNKRTVYVIDTDGKVVFAARGKPSVGEIVTALER